MMYSEHITIMIGMEEHGSHFHKAPRVRSHSLIMMARFIEKNSPVGLKILRPDLCISELNVLPCFQLVMTIPTGALHLLSIMPVSYTHLRAHETGRNLVCRLL